MFSLSMFGGWFALARKFRCENEFEGKKFRFCSAYMRFFCHYGSVLTLGTASTGLYMAIFPIFRVGHPPLLIPWSEVTVLKGETGIVFKRRRLLLGREESIPLSISNSLAEDLRTAAGQAWPVETIAA